MRDRRTDGRTLRTRLAGARVFAACWAAAALVAIPLPRATAGERPDARAARLIAAERTARGLGALVVDDELSRVARAHSAWMARAGAPEHLPAAPPGEVGENVGTGPGVPAVHRAFMGSPVHRGNILSEVADAVGIGVVRHDGRIYVTQIFSAGEGASGPPARTDRTPTTTAPGTHAPATAARAAETVRAPRTVSMLIRVLRLDPADADPRAAADAKGRG